MEGITESRFLSLFGCQCLDRLQIKVVVQMKIVEIFPVNQQVQHVIALGKKFRQSFKITKVNQVPRSKEMEK